MSIHKLYEALKFNTEDFLRMAKLSEAGATPFEPCPYCGKGLMLPLNMNQVEYLRCTKHPECSFSCDFKEELK